MCVDPDHEIVFCCVCNSEVHTCEREIPVDNDYTCPEHPDGSELSEGLWVCSGQCWDVAVSLHTLSKED